MQIHCCSKTCIRSGSNSRLTTYKNRCSRESAIRPVFPGETSLFFGPNLSIAVWNRQVCLKALNEH